MTTSKRWTVSEQARLEAAFANGGSVDEVAGMLNRTSHSVKSRLARKGKSLTELRGAEPSFPAAPRPVFAEDDGPEMVVQDMVREELDSGPAVDGPVLTIAVGDTQHGEREFLIRSWGEVCRQAVSMARTLGPSKIKLLFTGDNITGASVFRGQEYAVTVADTSVQTIYSAYSYWRDLIDPLSDIAPVEGVAVDGNHDKSGPSLTLAREWTQVLAGLGVPVRYAGQRAVVNLAPDGSPQYLIGEEHGFGGSSYYANSYSLIRALAAHALQSTLLGRHDGEPIRRFVVGHTHWCNVGQDILGSDLRLDTVGGWTRPERYRLGGALRGVGMIAYVHTGDSMECRTVKPRASTLRLDADDPLLAWRNMADVAETMIDATEAMIESGAMAKPGEVY